MPVPVDKCRFALAAVALACAYLLTGNIGRALAAAGGHCDGRGPVSWSETIAADDGAPLYLLVKGVDCGAPALLWLHGGPGGAERPLFRLYNGALEADFTVAYYDQRGAGRSYVADADPEKLTIAHHLRDLDQIVDHLRSRLRKDRIVLVGHSWGGALAMLYAHAHPEKIAAVIAVAPLVSGFDSEQAQYDFVAAAARQRNDRAALDRLKKIGRPPFPKTVGTRVQNLVDKYGGLFHVRPNKMIVAIKGVVHGYVSPFEIGKIIRGNDVSLEAMHDEVEALDLRRSVPAIKVPTVFMLGRFDRQADARIAAGYFETLAAPEKLLIWFDNSAHNIPFEQPKLFNQRLKHTLDTVLKNAD